jgi:hypothetical protein
MKKILFVLPFLILLSCSVQKRKYQKGFYVSNHKQSQKSQNTSLIKHNRYENKVLVLKPAILPGSSINNDELIVSAEDKPIQINSTRFKKKIISPDSLCDRIILKNGDESMVKIYEISPTEVKYKKCDMQDGPLYIVKKADVFMINFANGTKEVFNTTDAGTNSNSNDTGNKNNTSQKTYNGPKHLHTGALLALIFGVLGFITYGVGSLVAVILANKAIKKIKQNPEMYSGEILAKIGRVLGIIMLVIMALVVITIFAAIIGI